MNLRYLVVMGLAVFGCAVMYAHLMQKKQGVRGFWCALLSLVLGLAFGVVCSRLAYFLFQLRRMIAAGWIRSLTSKSIIAWSFYGGALGACLGVALSAKITGIRPTVALNTFAPAGALLGAAFRFGEAFLINDQIGLGMYVENEALCFFPLSVMNEFEEYYLAVFLLEGLFCLITAVHGFAAFREHTFPRTLFYFCLPQIFCESLLNECIKFIIFVRVEQLVSMLVLVGVLLYYALQTKGKKRFVPLWTALACAAVFVGIEFALDKTEIPHVYTYSLMWLGLIVLGFAENRAYRGMIGNQAS